MAGLRDMTSKPGRRFGEGDTTGPDHGSVRPGKKPKIPKVPKDKGRPKRKVKVTFNSPKTTKITYG